jgi:hypothetical protein
MTERKATATADAKADVGRPSSLDNYCVEVESVSVSTRAVRAVLLEELGYGEDDLYRCERLGL